MSSQHTPGPWRVEDTSICASTGPIAQVYSFVPDTEANARLITAAPQLLEACRVSLALMQTGGMHPISPDGQNIEKLCQNAITAAEGES